MAMAERARLRLQVLQIFYRRLVIPQVLPDRIARAAVNERESTIDFLKPKAGQELSLVAANICGGPLDRFTRYGIEVFGRHAADRRFFVISGDDKGIEIAHGADAFRRPAAVADRVSEHPCAIEQSLRVGEHRLKRWKIGVDV